MKCNNQNYSFYIGEHLNTFFILIVGFNNNLKAFQAVVLIIFLTRYDPKNIPYLLIIPCTCVRFFFWCIWYNCVSLYHHTHSSKEPYFYLTLWVLMDLHIYLFFLIIHPFYFVFFIEEKNEEQINNCCLTQHSAKCMAPPLMMV